MVRRQISRTHNKRAYEEIKPPAWKPALSWVASRCAPCALFIYVHYAYPDLEDRLDRWGANFYILRGTPSLHRVLTHVIVHASERHLWSNVLSYFVAVATTPRMQSLQCFYGVFIGGALSGLSATYLEHKYHRTRSGNKYGLGIQMLATVISSAQKLWQDRIPFCGSSAGIYALLCYNATVRGYFWGAFSIACGELVQWVERNPGLPSLAGGFADQWLSQRFVVGHWAHLGGMLFGAFVGCIQYFVNY